jgi:glycosyltransferase involved in cell wall biosynthesis
VSADVPFQSPRGEPRSAILYFGNDWFAENRTSSHQIARCLAKKYRVYYIECPGLRAPKSTGRDLKKIWQKLCRWWRGPQAAGDHLSVLTLLQLPLHRFAAVRRFNRWLIRSALRRLIRRASIHRPITWFMVPHLASVVGQLGERLAIYYCIDDYASLPDVDAAAVQAMDEELTEKADLVFVASATLFAEKQRLNPHTYVSPHGVDFDHFACGRSHGPTDLAALKRPLVGFFGLIERWIDLELIDYLAARRPDVNFVMIGRIAVPDSELPRRANLHWLGVRPYAQLPAYGRQFDAAIIPYRLTQQVLHANPIKLREYLALGKPVVSVSTPEIDRYADVVEIARSREEFFSKLGAVLARPPSAAERQRRTDRVARESWESRVDEILRIVSRRLTPAAPSFAERSTDRELISVGGAP